MTDVTDQKSISIVSACVSSCAKKSIGSPLETDAPDQPTDSHSSLTAIGMYSALSPAHLPDVWIALHRCALCTVSWDS